MDKKENLMPDPKTEDSQFMRNLSDLEVLNEVVLNKALQMQKQLSVNTGSLTDPYESPQTDKLAVALAKAQSEFPDIGANRKNGFLNSQYTDLNHIMNTIRKPLTQNGLAVTQQTILVQDDKVLLKTRLRHSSGQWIETRAKIRPEKDNAQSYGSALTYMRRYQITALLNITVNSDVYDDDAEIEMKTYRNKVMRGTDKNIAYQPSQESYETITTEQREELEYEISGFDRVQRDLLLEEIYKTLRIDSLGDIPKSKYREVSTFIKKVLKERSGKK